MFSGARFIGQSASINTGQTSNAENDFAKDLIATLESDGDPILKNAKAEVNGKSLTMTLPDAGFKGKVLVWTVALPKSPQEKGNFKSQLVKQAKHEIALMKKSCSTLETTSKNVKNTTAQLNGKQGESYLFEASRVDGNQLNLTIGKTDELAFKTLSHQEILSRESTIRIPESSKSNLTEKELLMFTDGPQNFNLDSALDKIGTYQTNIESQDPKNEAERQGGLKALAKLKQNDKAMTALYKGTVTNRDTSKRRHFLEKLNKRFEHVKVADPLLSTTTMKQLLGDELLKDYQAALEEEFNDKDFRDAVFTKSASELEGSPSSDGKKLELYVVGPSASGKSYLTKKITKKLIESAKTCSSSETDSAEHYAVAVDGGAERELSQMRNMTLQLAIQKGYSGISDLEKKSKVKVKIKKSVDNAVSQMDSHVHKILPITFGHPKEYLNLKSKLNKPNPNTEIVLASIEGANGKKAFRDTIFCNGRDRAYAHSKNPKGTSFEMNKTGLPESKSFPSYYFYTGYLGSQVAKKLAKNKGCRILTIKSEDMHLRKNDIGQWVTNPKSLLPDSKHPTISHIPSRVFTLYKELRTKEGWLEKRAAFKKLFKSYPEDNREDFFAFCQTGDKGLEAFFSFMKEKKVLPQTIIEDSNDLL